MARIQSKGYPSSRSGLVDLPANLLPKLEALRIDFSFAIGEVESGVSGSQPSGQVDEQKRQPGGGRKSIQKTGSVALERHFLASADESLALICRKPEDPFAGRALEKITEMDPQNGANSKLEQAKTSRRRA
jgi:hypothetical protein